MFTRADGVKEEYRLHHAGQEVDHRGVFAQGHSEWAQVGPTSWIACRQEHKQRPVEGIALLRILAIKDSKRRRLTVVGYTRL